jgi:DNA-binding XRE family transcriptional regulator
MNKEFAKYFWGFNDKALREAEKALKDAEHPRFAYYAVILLSRCDNPKEAFRFIPKSCFIAGWRKIRVYWRRLKIKAEFRDWWQEIYNSLLETSGRAAIKYRENGSDYFKGVGAKIREFRIKLNMSQKDLAKLSGIKQPDISKIEEGKKNITLETLIKICKIIGLSEIKIF